MNYTLLRTLPCNLKIKIKLISKAFLMQKESKEWLMAVIVVFNW